MIQVECRGLALGYGGRVVSQDISFSVSAGDYLCVVGENGAGKSTLIKTLIGLNAPISGEIEFMGGLKQTEIGYLPQQSHIQRDFPATVEEVVVSGFLNQSGMRPFFSRRERSLAHENLDKLGALPLKKRGYRELSGGQQQRVLLARALCATRKLLLMDEPVSGLDPVATNEMYTIIRDLSRHDGITVVMISHDVACAVREASHILHLSHKPLFFGTTRAYQLSEVGRMFAHTEGGANA